MKEKYTTKNLLSKEEYKVMVLLKKGYRNVAIAKELGIVTNTVGTYIRRIKIKLELDLEVNVYLLVQTAIDYKLFNKRN